jgi:hypothetical protein
MRETRQRRYVSSEQWPKQIASVKSQGRGDKHHPANSKGQDVRRLNPRSRPRPSNQKSLGHDVDRMTWCALCVPFRDPTTRIQSLECKYLKGVFWKNLKDPESCAFPLTTIEINRTDSSAADCDRQFSRGLRTVLREDVEF